MSCPQLCSQRTRVNYVNITGVTCIKSIVRAHFCEQNGSRIQTCYPTRNKNSIGQVRSKQQKLRSSSTSSNSSDSSSKSSSSSCCCCCCCCCCFSSSSSGSGSSNSNSNSNKLLYLHDRIILQYCKSMHMTIKI